MGLRKSTCSFCFGASPLLWIHQLLLWRTHGTEAYHELHRIGLLLRRHGILWPILPRITGPQMWVSTWKSLQLGRLGTVTLNSTVDPALNQPPARFLPSSIGDLWIYGSITSPLVNHQSIIHETTIKNPPVNHTYNHWSVSSPNKITIHSPWVNDPTNMDLPSSSHDQSSTRLVGQLLPPGSWRDDGWRLPCFLGWSLDETTETWSHPLGDPGKKVTISTRKYPGNIQHLNSPIISPIIALRVSNNQPLSIFNHHEPSLTNNLYH